MDKSARIIYGTPLMEACGEVLTDFILSFEVKEDKEYYIRNMYGNWMVLKTDLEFCMEQNLVHYKKRKPKTKEEAETWTAEDSVSTAKVELFKLIAKIDEDMGKWMGSRKGKTIIA